MANSQNLWHCETRGCGAPLGWTYHDESGDTFLLTCHNDQIYWGRVFCPECCELSTFGPSSRMAQERQETACPDDAPNVTGGES